MSSFIDNINDYIEQHKIKKTYLILATGWSKDKLYRILRGASSITLDEMQELADALHQDIEYFLKNYDNNKYMRKHVDTALALFAGNDIKDSKEVEYTKQVVEFIDTMDALLSIDI